MYIALTFRLRLQLRPHGYRRPLSSVTLSNSQPIEVMVPRNRLGARSLPCRFWHSRPLEGSWYCGEMATKWCALQLCTGFMVVNM